MTKVWIWIIALIVEVYFYQVIRVLLKDASPFKRKWGMGIYLGLTVLMVAGFVLSAIQPPPMWPAWARFYVLPILFILLLIKLIPVVFLILEDIYRLLLWAFGRKKKGARDSIQQVKKGLMPRSVFFSRILGSFAALELFGLLYGIFKGAYNYKIHKVALEFPHFPAAFDGLRAVQISDIHSGSFRDTQALEEAFRLIMEQKPDIIFFTGDLVNNVADEAHPFAKVFRNLNAPLGVYSITGNHDYGDYVHWESESAKKENFKALKKVHREAGWHLLLNDHHVLERNGDKIAIVGVENWGGNLHFKRYGDLERALEGTAEIPFKILLSHDPSHWDMQVRQQRWDVDVTFSGHTHGFQLGIEIPGFKWSPSRFVYPHWAGLYKDKTQYLYVNRGLGFLGYPGRLGIWPEITVIDFKKQTVV